MHHHYIVQYNYRILKTLCNKTEQIWNLKPPYYSTKKKIFFNYDTFDLFQRPQRVSAPGEVAAASVWLGPQQRLRSERLHKAQSHFCLRQAKPSVQAGHRKLQASWKPIQQQDPQAERRSWHKVNKNNGGQNNGAGCRVAVSPRILGQTELVFVRSGGGLFVRAANLATGPVQLEYLRSSGGSWDHKRLG